MSDKVSKNFKDVVQRELQLRADADPLFAANFAKPGKNIDECISYILNTVKKSGISGFTDDEIFGMAAHYYDKDDLGKISKTNCKVVVNHQVQLTPEEIKAAKDEAKAKVLADEMDRLRKKPEVKKTQVEPTQNFLF